MYVGIAQLDPPDIDDGVQTIDWGAVFLAASDCCKDAVNSNRCLGNDAFLEHALCNMSIAVAEKVGEGCAAMTCNGGSSVAGLVDDDGRYALADDDKGVIGDDTDMAGDETGEANDDASAAGDTGGASRVGSSSSSPSVMLMAARGLALMMAATPFLAASW